MPDAGENTDLIFEAARAKVNLTLAVLGRRTDGYHALDSLVAFADFGDEVRVDFSRAAGVTCCGELAGAIVGENILGRALALLREADRGLELGHVTVLKRLPVAAGLGGGSADAGALVRAVRRRNSQRAASIDWDRIGRRLGADVPVCIESRTAMMRGTGERLEPVEMASLDVVLINPQMPVPANKTAAVFAALAAPPLAGDARATVLPADVAADRVRLLAWIARAGNDLEVPSQALMPAIGHVKAALAAQPACELARMSGAGPTCFGIFPDAATAQRAAVAIRAVRADWWVTATRLG